MPKSPTLIWFRQDLRLNDNPALACALETDEIIPVYILDDVNPESWELGSASRWWLHQSLTALNKDLKDKLWVLSGDPLTVLTGLVKEHGVAKVVWNRAYEPWQTRRDTAIKSALSPLAEVESFNGSMLWEPWTNLKDDGTPYRVFTPYYKRAIKDYPVREPLNSKGNSKAITNKLASCLQGETKIDALGLLPDIPWHESLAKHWQPGEAGAAKRLDSFLEQGLSSYKTGRDFPAQRSVSRLSPHLHFGEVSPNQLWHAALTQTGQAPENEIEHFQRELVWREFSYYLLYHFPTIPDENLYAHFDGFPWLNDPDALTRWQRGTTGFPLVDAGMRELWQTGYMHNRVRMIVGSFLIKNMLMHWRHGADWFWDCLVDADLASNSASWQWVAGSGADAAPYFRIFNPVTQSAKFDPSGEYIKKYVPELSSMPDKYLHDPSNAPAEVLEKAGVVLDKDYPRAILNLKETRERALNAYATIKEAPRKREP
jgi:deoxyribodipyrimidine photo-lyase